LDWGAKLDWQYMGGFTALMMASQFGHAEVVKLLLDRGAKLDLQVSGGPTALLIASAHGNTEVVKLLLENGANPDLKTIEGKTAYDYAKNDEIKTLLTNYMKKQ
jgi:ankyrin repeat protein